MSKTSKEVAKDQPRLNFPQKLRSRSKSPKGKQNNRTEDDLNRVDDDLNDTDGAAASPSSSPKQQESNTSVYEEMEDTEKDNKDKGNDKDKDSTSKNEDDKDKGNDKDRINIPAITIGATHSTPYYQEDSTILHNRVRIPMMNQKKLMSRISIWILF